MLSPLDRSDYVVTNKNAFNLLANEYNARWRKYLVHQETVLRPFEARLRQNFEDPISVLDVGCGVGLDSYILTEHGFQVKGIDIAERMVEHARQNAPKASFEEIDFLTYTKGQFQGIVMGAFFHLFPKVEATVILKRAKSLLVQGGFCFISTTKSEKSIEGYFEKEDYPESMRRFRKFWTEQEFRETLEQNGFKIVDFYYDYEQTSHKSWINALLQVSRE